MSDKITDVQPRPKPNDRPSSWQLVIADAESRDQYGRKKYGTPLQPENGRDSLQDAYEEVLDLVVYLRNELEERKLRKNAASKLVNEYLHSDTLTGKSLAQNIVIDVRDLLVNAGL